MRSNPLVQRIAAAFPVQWGEIGGMKVPLAVEGEEHHREIALADLSCVLRCGLKGSGAAACLAELELPVPKEANTWMPLPDNGLIGRLGTSEFFVEDGLRTETVRPLWDRLQMDIPDVYPVMRQDTELVLTGILANDLLNEVCSVNFSAIEPRSQELVMTSMVGVPVLVIPIYSNELTRYRIWCDPTFAPYLWDTLCEIAREMGGGPIGWQRLGYGSW